MKPDQYAAIMGMNKQLGLIGNNFSNAASAFYIAYLIAEIPNGACESLTFDYANCHIRTDPTVSVYPPKGCGSKMAGGQCDSVGHRNRLYGSRR